MTAVSDAMTLLGLHDGFTSQQLRKQYYRCALRSHPDKGGDVIEMQKIAAANDLLEAFFSSEAPPTTFTEPPAEHPTPCPNATVMEDAISDSSEFLRALRDTPKSSRHRASAMQLWHCISPRFCN